MAYAGRNMDSQMDIRKEIEEQRKRLDSLADQMEDLVGLLEEARKMDLLVEEYEAQITTS